MNFKSTALLFGLLLAMLWTFGVMLAVKRGSVDDNAVLPSLQGDPDVVIDSVIITRDKDKKSEKIVFTKDKDNWRMQQPPLATSVRVESFKVTQIVNQVKDARRDDEADTTSNLSFYDLDRPSVVITLKGHSEKRKDDEKVKGPEKEWKLNIGKDQGGFVYVTSSDRPSKVAAIKKSSLDSVFFADTSSLRPKNLLDVIDSTARLIDIKQSKSDAGPAKELEFRKNDDGTWRFVKPNFGLADSEGPKAPENKLAVTPPPKQEGGVKGLLNAISGIRVGSDVDFVPLSDAALASYGLEDGKESLRIVVSSGGDKKDKKDDAKKDDALEDSSKDALLIGFKVQGKDQYYARLSTDPGVVKIDAKLLEPILAALKDPGKLRSRDLIPAETKNVDAIDLRQGKDLNVLVKLRRPDEKAWQVYFGSEAKKADDRAVQSLIETLQARREVKDFLDIPEADAKKKDADLGFTPPTAEIVLYSDGIEKPKDDKKDDKDKEEKKKEDKKDEKKDQEPKLKKDAKPLVTLVFGKAEGDLIYVKRTTQDGGVARMQVTKSVFDKAFPAQGAIAFLDSSLPVIDDNKITGLELERGKDKYVVMKGRGEQSDRWLLKDIKDYAGKNFADTPQMNTILSLVGNLRAQKWVDKLDPKADLDKYGLAKPDVTVTVNVGKDQFTPSAIAGIVGLFATGTADGAVVGIAALQAASDKDKGDTVTFKFGSEVKEKEKDKETTVVYATRSGTDLLFQVSPAVVKVLKDADLRDRSWLSMLQPILDASLVGMAAAPEGLGPLWLGKPLTTGRVISSLDPTRVYEIKLAIRSRYELRSLAFRWNVKDKTWEDRSGLLEFTADADKIKQFLEWISELNAERFIFLSGGAQEEQKLSAKDATLKIDIAQDNGKTLTLTVGAPNDGRGYFATTSAWPEVVFQLPATRIEPILDGAAYFAKPRVAAR